MTRETYHGQLTPSNNCSMSFFLLSSGEYILRINNPKTICLPLVYLLTEYHLKYSSIDHFVLKLLHFPLCLLFMIYTQILHYFCCAQVNQSHNSMRQLDNGIKIQIKHPKLHPFHLVDACQYFPMNRQTYPYHNQWHRQTHKLQGELPLHLTGSTWLKYEKNVKHKRELTIINIMIIRVWRPQKHSDLPRRQHGIINLCFWPMT
jgi:hypothetical protein